jgi:hypothetical protein
MKSRWSNACSYRHSDFVIGVAGCIDDAVDLN